MNSKELFQSTLDVSGKFQKLWLTYKWANSLTRYDDLTATPPGIVYRCRYFFPGSVLAAIVFATTLLRLLNINVLNIARSASNYRAFDDLALGIAQDWAAAIPHVSLHNMNFTKQSEVVVAASVLAIGTITALAFLAGWRRSPHATRRQQLVFSSFIFSVSLIRFSVVSVAAACVVWLAQKYGFEPSSNFLISFGVLLVTFIVTGCWNLLSNQRAKASGGRAARDDGRSFLYSTLAPIVATLILLYMASGVGERFKPSIVLATSDACGASDKGTCVLTVRPQDIDGTVSLDKVQLNLQMIYSDEENIVGPVHVVPASAMLRVVQSPDMPFPLEVAGDEVQGAVGFAHFTCPPPSQSDHSRKMLLKSYSAYANARVKNDVDFGRREEIIVRFDAPFDVALAFRNITSGCAFFP